VSIGGTATGGVGLEDKRLVAMRFELKRYRTSAGSPGREAIHAIHSRSHFKGIAVLVVSFGSISTISGLEFTTTLNGGECGIRRDGEVHFTSRAGIETDEARRREIEPQQAGPRFLCWRKCRRKVSGGHGKFSDGGAIKRSLEPGIGAVGDAEPIKVPVAPQFEVEQGISDLKTGVGRSTAPRSSNRVIHGIGLPSRCFWRSTSKTRESPAAASNKMFVHIAGWIDGSPET